MKRILLPLVAILLYACIVAGLHYYLATRLVLEPALPEPWRSLALATIAALALAVGLLPLAERTLPPRRVRPIAWPASVWMGYAFLALVQLLATDPLLWLGGSVASAATGSPAPDASGVRAAIVALVALVAGSLALRGGLAPPRLARVEIPLRRWPRALEGFRVVQISDVHIGPILGRRFAAEVTRRVNELAPDLVAVTGDLVDGSARYLGEEVAPFGELRGRHGVYFVTGNHDHYSGAQAWSDTAAELGMRVLRNQRVAIERDGAVFDLAGVDDHRGGHFGDDGREDLDAALAGRDPERPLLLLAHDPSTFKRAWQRGVDLQLSGHTHGGQIFPFAFFVRLAIPFVAGRYRRGDAELYVSRGTGFWGPPMRLGAPAEITEIVLRAAPETEEETT